MQVITRQFPAVKLASARSSRIVWAPKTAVILWVCLWCNLNSGFWNFGTPKTFGDLVMWVRAALPFAVLPIATFLLLRRSSLHLPKWAPSRLLLIYGLIATIATAFSPMPSWSIYWSIAFLATILAAWTFVDQANQLESARQLLQLTWAATFVVAAIIAYQARGTVFGDTASAYGINEQLNGLARSSGVARWAAVPGLVCLIRAYYTRRRILIAGYLALSALCFFIVYRMQSRGAVFGLVAAFAFTLIVSSKMRRYALPFALIAIVLIFLVESPRGVSSHVTTYIERGQSKEEFFTMTGRTRAYSNGFSAFEEAPIIGRGQWADRLVISEHVHNSFIQALLNAGILGGIPYFASWLVGWLLFYRLQNSSLRLRPADRNLVMECGAVMMFFTVRAVPETTTASYAVDLLVMVAVYVYLETLTLQVNAKRLRPVFQSVAVGAPPMSRQLVSARVGANRQR